MESQQQGHTATATTTTHKNNNNNNKSISYDENKPKLNGSALKTTGASSVSASATSTTTATTTTSSHTVPYSTALPTTTTVTSTPKGRRGGGGGGGHSDHHNNRIPPSPSSQIASTSEFDSSLIIDIAETASIASTTNTKRSRHEAERDSGSESKHTGMSRKKQLLSRRHRHKDKGLLGTRRQRLLEEAKEKGKRSEYEAARLSSRLDIIHLFVDHSLVDDTFLGKREINPWRFKNQGLEKKYNFVNNLVTTQEMLVIVEDAKARERRKRDEESRLTTTIEDAEKVEQEQEDKSNNSDDKPNQENSSKEDKSEDTKSIDGTKKDGKGKSKNSSRSKSASSSMVYAFGSTHNKAACHYCGSLQCKGQLNRTRMNMNGKRLDSIGQRISDFRGIYQKEKWRLKYTKKIHERIRTIDQELNAKLVKSSESMQGYKK